jgi:hypothetical protein
MALYGGTILNLTKCHHSIERERYRYLLDEAFPRCPICGALIAQKDIDFFRNSQTVDGSRYPTGNNFNNYPTQLNLPSNPERHAEYMEEWNRLQAEGLEEERAQARAREAERQRKLAEDIEFWESKAQAKPKGWFSGLFGFGVKHNVDKDIKYLQSIK